MATVLVVDDSKFMAKSLKTLLEGMEFDVVGLAHDGLQGIEQFQKCRPDVILLDVTMPNMDGLECLRAIREIDAQARVVMLSAIKDEDTISHCLEAGAQYFLEIPIRKNNPEDLKRLSDALDSAMEKAV